MATQVERDVGITPLLEVEKPEPYKSILDLPQIVKSELSPSERKVFLQIYDKPQISETPMHYSSPEALSNVARRFNVKESQVTERAALRVANIVLDEETLFNP